MAVIIMYTFYFRSLFYFLNIIYSLSMSLHRSKFFINIILNGLKVFNIETSHHGFNHSPTIAHLGCFQFCPLKCDEYLFVSHFVCILGGFLTVIPEVAFQCGKNFKAFGIYSARLFLKDET